ncbi:hypothetical protein J2T13_004423 [Paenibacillus sp. DS2015]
MTEISFVESRSFFMDGMITLNATGFDNNDYNKT